MISREAVRYGYYEARMKVPPGAGWHTSFWMMAHGGLGGTKPDGARQEIDVIENDSVHPRSYGVNIHKGRDGHVAFGGRTVKVPEGEQSLSEEFHVFGAEFTPKTVTFYLDGRVVQTVDGTSARRKDGTTVPFPHGDQNVWLTAIASHLGGTKAVDDARLPTNAEFDYVRVFAPSAESGEAGR